MFDNLTSINQFFFGLRSVTYRKSKTESHGVCCRVQKKPNSGLIQADSGSGRKSQSMKKIEGNYSKYI